MFGQKVIPPTGDIEADKPRPITYHVCVYFPIQIRIKLRFPTEYLLILLIPPYIRLRVNRDYYSAIEEGRQMQPFMHISVYIARLSLQAPFDRLFSC